MLYNFSFCKDKWIDTKPLNVLVTTICMLHVSIVNLNIVFLDILLCFMLQLIGSKKNKAMLRSAVLL